MEKPLDQFHHRAPLLLLLLFVQREKKVGVTRPTKRKEEQGHPPGITYTLSFIAISSAFHPSGKPGHQAHQPPSSSSSRPALSQSEPPPIPSPFPLRAPSRLTLPRHRRPPLFNPDIAIPPHLGHVVPHWPARRAHARLVLQLRPHIRPQSRRRRRDGAASFFVFGPCVPGNGVQVDPFRLFDLGGGRDVRVARRWGRGGVGGCWRGGC